MAYIRYRPRTVAIDVLLSFNLAVVFNLKGLSHEMDFNNVDEN